MEELIKSMEEDDDDEDVAQNRKLQFLGRNKLVSPSRMKCR